MAAKSRLGQAQLEADQAKADYDMAFFLFNQWLNEDSLYEAGGKLTLPESISDYSLQTNNPHLQLIRAQKEVTESNIEIQRVQLLPQINSGVRLQNAFGDFPLFGVQIGVNVPLAKKAYKVRMEAAEVGVEVQEAAYKTEQQKVERIIIELHSGLLKQMKLLEYLKEELTPLVNDQSLANLEAYKEGETGYLEYLDSMEQLVKVQRQYLEALYKFHVLKVNLDYWTGE